MIFTKKGYRSRLFRLAKRLLVFIALTAFNIILFRSIIGVMWLYVTIATSVFVLGKLAISFLFFVTVRYYHLKNNRVKRTLLVGQNETMGKVEKIIKANPILNYNFIGYISDSDATEKGDFRIEKRSRTSYS